MNSPYHYTTDLNILSENRKPGVSGMMRVKNDAEFIELCVESCIEALDELVIVYNDCSDESPTILCQMAEKYPDKIRVFEYKPQIYAWNLTETEIKNIFNNSIPQENTLAGYYNFALSKTTRSFVMKIDADQIYYTPHLKKICDCYRCTNSDVKVSLFDKVTIWGVRGYIYICSKFKISSGYLIRKRIFHKYINVIYKYVEKYKINVSLSGVNVYINEEEIYVTLGKNTQTGLNILNPYNGEGDHLIFKVTPETYFIPAIDKAYTKINGLNTSVIETLRGTGRIWPIGLFWVHLNSCRIKNKRISKDNFRKYPNCYIKINEFKDEHFNIKYFNIENSENYWYRLNNLSLIHNSLDIPFIRFIFSWKARILQNLNPN